MNANIDRTGRVYIIVRRTTVAWTWNDRHGANSGRRKDVDEHEGVSKEYRGDDLRRHRSRVRETESAGGIVFPRPVSRAGRVQRTAWCRCARP